MTSAPKIINQKPRTAVSKTLFNVILAYTILVFAPLAMADNVVGFLTHGSDSSLQLKIQSSDQTFSIQASADVDSILNGLKEGSLIIGTGRIMPIERKVQIDAVQTVGLKELLGKWRSTTAEIFEFKSFSKLMRYAPNSNVEGSAPGPRSKVENFDYALSPDRDKSFSIFMSDTEMRMLVGTLHFVDHTILLTVYDSQTGLEAEKISLSPFSPIPQLPIK